MISRPQAKTLFSCSTHMDNKFIYPGHEKCSCLKFLPPLFLSFGGINSFFFWHFSLLSIILGIILIQNDITVSTRNYKVNVVGNLDNKLF